MQTFARNKLGGVVSRARLSIYPESDDLLIGQISQAEYAEVDQKFPEENSDFNDLAYNEWTLNEPLNKPFKIHLENSAIRSLSVDSRMSNHHINQLKFIVSQFQVDTNAQNEIQSEDNHLPEEDSNNAYYKTMEPTVSGNCETIYDISALPDYLVQTHPDWVPLPELREEGEFIKIIKTKNFNNCNERSGYLDNNDESTNKMDFKPRTSENEKDLSGPLVTRIIISGDLRTYTIQSSVTTSKRGSSYDYVNLTLESVEQSTIRPKFRSENLVNIGNLLFTNDFPESGRPMIDLQNSNRANNLQNSLRSDPKCPKAPSKYTFFDKKYLTICFRS